MFLFRTATRFGTRQTQKCESVPAILTVVKLRLTSADDLVEVEQQLLPGDHHMLHLS